MMAVTGCHQASWTDATTMECSIRELPPFDCDCPAGGAG